MVFSSFHLSRDTVRHYTAALLAFRPFVVEGYVSSIYWLARLAEEEGLALPAVRAVQTTSETLLPFQRRVIEDAFACKAYDQYGHGEAAVFVSECEQGRLHVSEEYGALELVRDGHVVPAGEVGEVVVTGLNNWSMPLIRYRTGDLASAADDVCPCGRGLGVLRSLEGRILDTLVLPDGRLVPPTALTLLFDRAHALGIGQARVRQVEPARIVVDVVRSPRWSNDQDRALEAELRLIMGPSVRIEFNDVDEIPLTSAGKFRFVVNECVPALLGR